MSLTLEEKIDYLSTKYPGFCTVLVSSDTQLMKQFTNLKKMPYRGFYQTVIGKTSVMRTEPRRSEIRQINLRFPSAAEEQAKWIMGTVGSLGNHDILSSWLYLEILDILVTTVSKSHDNNRLKNIGNVRGF